MLDKPFHPQPESPDSCHWKHGSVWFEFVIVLALHRQSDELQLDSFLSGAASGSTGFASDDFDEDLSLSSAAGGFVGCRSGFLVS